MWAKRRASVPQRSSAVSQRPNLLSIHRLPIAFHTDRHRNRQEQEQRPQLGCNVEPAGSLEEDAAYDAQKMGEWQARPDPLRPLGHPAKWKHESGEQNRWQEKEERHLHGLKLVSRQSRERDSHREVRRDEQERHRIHQRNAADHRYFEQELRRE